MHELQQGTVQPAKKLIMSTNMRPLIIVCNPLIIVCNPFAQTLKMCSKMR
jgi:hypothetical protein